MEKNINYRGLFAAGITFLGAGVVLMINLGPVGIALMGLGFVMMAVLPVLHNCWSFSAVTLHTCL